jgi:hypothetical protein
VSKDRIGSNDIKTQTKKDSSGEAVVEDVKGSEPSKNVLRVCDLRASASPLKVETPIHLGRMYYVVVK